MIDYDNYYNKQESPKLPDNLYINDFCLKYYLKCILSEDFNKYDKMLELFGKECSWKLPLLCKEAELYKPTLEIYDAFGNSAWKKLIKYSIKNNIHSYQYNHINENNARVIQMTKTYIYSYLSGMTSCPMSMTDGAIYLLEYIKNNSIDLYSDNMKEASNRLKSSDPNYAYTSGQWMTELLGGSDVRGSTFTTARLYKNNIYKLRGLKWFTSAIDANITFTLAKIFDDKTNELDTKPTLFFLKIRKDIEKDDNRFKSKDILNNIDIVRLKDKLGTKQLPTAELILKNTIAEIASPRGKGLSYIMKLANITRLHNMCNSVGYMRGILFYVEDYSFKRKVFDKLLFSHGMHISTLTNIRAIHSGCLAYVLYCSKLVGEEYSSRINNNNADIKKANKLESLLRLLLPMGKMLTSKLSEEVCLAAIQSIGANAYMENSNIPYMLRDTMVTSIWEGTYNVLSLEFIKNYSIQNNRKMLFDIIEDNFKNVNNNVKDQEDIFKNINIDLNTFIYSYKDLVDIINKLTKNIFNKENIKSINKQISDSEFITREFVFSICCLFISSLVYKYSIESHNYQRIIISYFWIKKSKSFIEEACLNKVFFIYII